MSRHNKSSTQRIPRLYSDFLIESELSQCRTLLYQLYTTRHDYEEKDKNAIHLSIDLFYNTAFAIESLRLPMVSSSFSETAFELDDSKKSSFR